MIDILEYILICVTNDHTNFDNTRIILIYDIEWDDKKESKQNKI